jgi:PAS domain S-box-containing protein
MIPKPVNITDIISIRTLEKIQDNFSEATGLGSIIRDIHGNALTKASRLTKLWLTVNKNNSISHENLQRLLPIFEKCYKTGQIEIFNRYLDTHAFVVPIFLEGRISAFFIGGLVRYGNPDIELCEKEAGKLGIDLDTYLEMYLSIPLFTRERLLASANLIKIIASTVSSLAKEGTEIKNEKIDLQKKFNESEKELFLSEKRFRYLFETINDGIYVTDKNGIILDINKAGANFYGYEPKELIGTEIKNLYVNPEDRVNFLNTLYKSGHVERFHPYVKKRDGTKFYVETNSTVIKDENGTIIGVQGIFRYPQEHEIRQHSSINKQNDTQSVVSAKIKND